MKGSSLKEITIKLLESYDLFPKKRYGQHFLIDPGIFERIANVHPLAPEDDVLEIGTGLGIFAKLLAERAHKVTAVEIDPSLLMIAKDVLKTFKNIDFHQADILKFDLDRIPGGKIKVFGNLPYNITFPIIDKLLRFRRKFDWMVFLVQKEAAERMMAKPGNKIYGAFSVFVKNQGEIKIHSLVDRRAFYPQPRVDSAIISLVPFVEPKFNIDYQLVKKLFLHRRKMLRRLLKEENVDFEKLGINEKARPEELDLEGFERLSLALKK
jgi:16S rRNA (adenine1518-N6/adenine1519-N6)-dimethyltransferase